MPPRRQVPQALIPLSGKTAVCFCLQFNARSESVAEKPSFRRLVPTRRCLVLTEGFYEWLKVRRLRLYGASCFSGAWGRHAGAEAGVGRAQHHQATAGFHVLYI